MKVGQYESMINHLNKVVSINLPFYKIIKNQIIEYEDVSLKKFRDFCYEVSEDIAAGKDSKTEPWTSDDELSMYITVLYYRLVRNLISIRELLNLTGPESEHFEAYEFSIGILLRSGLCDCKDYYKVDLENHVGKYLKSSFDYLIRDVRKNSTESDEKSYSILYFSRLREGIGNYPTPLRDPANYDKLRYLEDYKKYCDYLYSIYSKYDHFSLFEISPMLTNMGDRKNFMYSSIMIQVQAIAQILTMFQHQISTIPTEAIDELYQLTNEWAANMRS